MRQGFQAYGKVAHQTANPRELEANLLLRAAAQLQSVHDAWDDRKPQLDAALIYNRKLWTVLMTSVTEKDHPLPREIRQNVANLGLFVMNHTIGVMADPRADQLQVLININREIASGLLGR